MSIQRSISLLDKGLRCVELIAVVLAGIIMIVSMILVASDAILRYLFNAPLSFQYHLTENYLLVALVTLALAWGYRTGGYIRITFLVSKMSIKVKELVLRAGLLISAIYIGVLAWRGGKYFWYAYESNQVQMGLIDWPVAWSWVWVPVGCGLLAMRLVLVALGPSSELHHEHNDVGEEL